MARLKTNTKPRLYNLYLKDRKTEQEQTLSCYHLSTDSDTFGTPARHYFHEFVKKGSLEEKSGYRGKYQSRAHIYKVITTVSLKKRISSYHNNYFFTNVPRKCPTPYYHELAEKIEKVSKAIRGK